MRHQEQKSEKIFENRIALGGGGAGGWQTSPACAASQHDSAFQLQKEIKKEEPRANWGA